MSFAHMESARDNAAAVPGYQPLLLAAGSLAQAMDDMMAAYAQQGGAHFAAQYGPSGKLLQEIEAGKRADVFASASTGHTKALATKQRMSAPHVFAHNQLCILARPELQLNEANLLEVLGRADVRLAASTPVSDPMGDYTWQFFENAEHRRPGLYRHFDAKALKLSGARAPAPGAKLPYVTAFEEDRADAYIMYCTNAVATRKALPHLVIVPIPHDLNVYSDYGIVAHPDSDQGRLFIEFVLSSPGQAILQSYGFS